MNTIDYIYRFDPKNPSTKLPPSDADSARKSLEDGNRTFARWMRSCQAGTLSEGEEAHHLVECNGLEVGLVRKPGGAPRQSPFAIVVGCSDARAPTEMIFGQGFNNLFVVRVAGNVCLGSVDFAVDALKESVKAAVVLGHSGCGAVTGAVNAYLQPPSFWPENISPALQMILQKIFVSVREAANCLKEVWGPTARDMDGHKDALIETAVALNAAQTAFALRQSIGNSGRPEIEVFYGVYNPKTHEVGMPSDPSAPPSDANVNLAAAPSSPGDFRALGLKMAEILKSP